MLCFRATSLLASGKLRTHGIQKENVTFSLQTKRALYLTKTPLNCNLCIILMPLHVESDSCDRSGVEYLLAKKHLQKLCVVVFCSEGKILLTLFGNHIFHLVTEINFSHKMALA